VLVFLPNQPSIDGDIANISAVSDLQMSYQVEANSFLLFFRSVWQVFSSIVRQSECGCWGVTAVYKLCSIAGRRKVRPYEVYSGKAVDRVSSILVTCAQLTSDTVPRNMACLYEHAILVSSR
jgi:hypothetical protein